MLITAKSDYSSLDRALREARARLSLRRWLNVNADALLAGLGVAAICALLQVLGLLPRLAAAGAGTAAFAAAFLLRLPRGRVSESDAGLFLDEKHGLRERLGSYACARNAEGGFAQALRDDALAHLLALGQLGSPCPLLPRRAPYLAAPAAALLALSLLPGGGAASQETYTLMPEAGQPAAHQPAQTQGQLAELTRQLQAAHEKYAKDPSTENLAEIRRLEEELRRELRQLGVEFTKSETDRENGGEERKIEGSQAERLGLPGEVEATAGAGAANAAEAAAAGPDWQAYGAIENELPLEYRDGVREYLRRLAEN